ncbi:MAG: hypothetical protein WCJ14_09705 [Verrucomicrobiota bacterium]
MARSKSILLFGEGKTDAVFLAHLRDLYRIPGKANLVIARQQALRRPCSQGIRRTR